LLSLIARFWSRLERRLPRSAALLRVSSYKKDSAALQEVKLLIAGGFSAG
jgi:hypothetical protein